MAYNNNIKINTCTFNVIGMAGSKKSSLLAVKISELTSVSVFALQETHATSMHDDKFYVYNSPGSARSCEVIS